MIALTREAKDLKDAHKQHLLHVQAVEKEKEEVEGVLRDMTAAYESTMRRDEEGRRKEKEGAQAAKEKHKRQLELLRSQLSQMETRIHQTTVRSDEDRASLREELRVEREACRSAEAALLEEKGASKDQAALIFCTESTSTSQERFAMVAPSSFSLFAAACRESSLLTNSTVRFVTLLMFSATSHCICLTTTSMSCKRFSACSLFCLLAALAVMAASNSDALDVS